MANEKRVRQNFVGGMVDTIDLPAADTVVTDGATTNASPTVTSATAAFVASDVGAPISGAGIPANSYIGVINSATSIGLSSTQATNTPVNATATATGVSVTIGRSRNFHSAGLAAIATAIGATNHLPIILDPDGVYGAPEIAYIIGLTAGASTATILRGQEGTTARQHLLDMPWVHGPTAADFNGLLANVVYNPAVLAAINSTGSLAAVDAANLAITFVVPPSGQVLVKLGSLAYANAAASGLSWALLNTSNALIAGTRRYITGSQAAILCGYTHKVTGLTPGAIVTYRWGSQTLAGSGGATAYGDDGTVGAYGPAVMEVWAVAV